MLAAIPLALLLHGGGTGSSTCSVLPRRRRRGLLRLVRTADSTRFGRDHHFASIGRVQDFQDRVPIRTYEQLWNGYWKAEFPKLED